MTRLDPPTQALPTAALTQPLERYVILEQIGSGATADVYRARDQLLDREVALKVLRGTDSDAARARFLAEGRILAALSHPGLTRLLDVGIEDEDPFLALELVEGRPLSGPVALAQVADAGRQLAEALAHAHANGVVHRDIKPGNVLIDKDGHVRLTDFGIARLIGDTVHLTDPGMTVGTAAYLAPEQVRGEPVGTAADVYALGLVLIEMITGRPVYTGPPVEAAVARLHAPPALPDHLDPAWQDLVTSMTADDPASRPTAAEVAVELAAFTPDGTGRVVSGRRSRLRIGAEALAAAAVVLIVALGAFLAESPHEPAASEAAAPRTNLSLAQALAGLQAVLVPSALVQPVVAAPVSDRQVSPPAKSGGGSQTVVHGGKKHRAHGKGPGASK